MQAYLDNSATTRPTDGVIEAVARAMREDFYNPSSLYAPAMIPEKQMNLCRDKIRKALHAADARVIFTSGGTEANNLALFGSIGRRTARRCRPWSIRACLKRRSGWRRWAARCSGFP